MRKTRRAIGTLVLEISQTLAWTEWSIAPTLGYGVSDKLMVGVNLSQADSSESMVLDLHARYFMTLGGHDMYMYMDLHQTWILTT